MLNWSPTDIVASSTNEGMGTKGMSDPKKLTRPRLRYPTSGANGNRSVKSTNHSFELRYLTIKFQSQKELLLQNH